MQRRAKNGGAALRQLSRLLEGLAVALVPLSAVISSVLLLVNYGVRARAGQPGRLPMGRPPTGCPPRWALVIVLGCAPLLVSRLFLDGFQATVWLALQLGLLLVLSVIARVRGSSLLYGGLAALLVFLTVSGAERYQTARSWENAAPGLAEVVNEGSLLAPRRLTADGYALNGQTGRLSAYRAWRLAPDTSSLELSGSVRLVSGQPGWDFVSGTQAAAIVPVEADEGEAEGRRLTRFTPSGDNPYIYRGVKTAAPLAGRSFRGRLELRAAPTATAEVCGVVYLSDQGSQHLSRQSVCAGEDWGLLELVWQAPDTVTSPIINLLLNGFDGPLDLRASTIEEQTAAGWQALSPLSPAGVALSLSWSEHSPWRHAANEEVSVRLLPTPDWQPFSLRAEAAALAEEQTVWAELFVERGLQVELKDLRLASPLGKQPQPSARLTRQAAGFEQFNLAGHTVAVLTLAVLVGALSYHLKRGVWLWGTVGVALGLVGVYLTGSRAALLGLGLGAAWLGAAYLGQARASKRPNIWLLGAVLVLGLGTALVLQNPARLGRFDLVSTQNAVTVSRRAIWSAGLSTFRAAPLTGLGAGGFADYWQTQYPGTSPLTHAHNFWLEWASRYGALGLLTSLWLSAGLLVVGWWQRRWAGVGVVAALLVMQVFDYTLFYAPVLLTALLCLNVRDASPRQLK